MGFEGITCKSSLYHPTLPDQGVWGSELGGIFSGGELWVQSNSWNCELTTGMKFAFVPWSCPSGGFGWNWVKVHQLCVPLSDDLFTTATKRPHRRTYSRHKRLWLKLVLCYQDKKPLLGKLGGIVIHARLATLDPCITVEGSWSQPPLVIWCFLVFFILTLGYVYWF